MIFGLLITGLVGCRPADNLLPTLAPTLVPPTDSLTVTALPTLAPTGLSTATATLTNIRIVSPTPANSPTVPASDLPSPAVPTLDSGTDSATIPPPRVVNSSGTLTITLTEAQLNNALMQRFTLKPLPGFSTTPHATLIAGGLQLTLTMFASAQPIRLTVTLAALRTMTGSQLDIRAIGLSTLNGVTTLQVKPAQNLLANVLDVIMQHAAANSRFDVTFVTVTPILLTLTVVMH